ncbi:MAG: ATP-binding protein [Chloroflexota bacterium]
MAEALEKVYEAIWAQTAKLLGAESFSVALCGPGPNQITYEFLIDRGVRQVPQTRELGDGLSDLVVRMGKPLLVRSFQLEDGSYPLSWMGAPMLSGDQVLGLVTVQRYREGAYQQKDLSILSTLAVWAASAIESRRSYQIQKQEAESSAVLLRVTRALTSEIEEPNLLRSIVEIAPTVVECDRCSTWRWVAERKEFEPSWRCNGHSKKAEEFESAPLRLEGVPAIGRLLETKDVVAVSDGDIEQLGTLRDSLSQELRYAALVPLMLEGELMGLIAVVRALEANSFTPREIDLLRTLADIAALAMQNLRHHRQKGEAAALRELSEMKSRLISTISHELRTPLSFVQAGSELLMQRLLDPEQLQQVAGLVNQGSVRLAEIVDDIILFADLQSGLMSFTPAPTDPTSLVIEVVDEVAGVSDSHRVAVNAADSLSTVLVDEAKLKSILVRLIRNALNFSPSDSPIEIDISFQENRLRIDVSDRGFGIPREEMDRLFDPFFRGEANQVRYVPGAGLGLSIVKQLVEAMGGEIIVDSKSGKGTTAAISIPVQKADGLQP